MRIVLGVVVAGVFLTGCAQPPTPAQERGYQAVEDCARHGLQRDWTYTVYPDGGIRFEGRADGFSPIQECLKSRWGYRF